MAHISTLVEVYETLRSLGYDAVFQENSVAVKVGGLDKPFAAVVTHRPSASQFQISCLVTKLGQVGEEGLLRFAVAALEANSRIVPFAFALITGGDDPKGARPEEWPVILTHAIPVGDLSRGELDAAMKSLVAALIGSRDVLQLIKPARVAKAKPKAGPAAKKAKVKAKKK